MIEVYSYTQTFDSRRSPKTCQRIRQFFENGRLKGNRGECQEFVRQSMESSLTLQGIADQLAAIRQIQEDILNRV